jgi:hypothetical protein
MPANFFESVCSCNRAVFNINVVVQGNEVLIQQLAEKTIEF